MGLPASLDLLLTADILICMHIIITATDTEAEVSYPVTDSSTTSNGTVTSNGKPSPLLNPPYIVIMLLLFLTCTHVRCSTILSLPWSHVWTYFPHYHSHHHCRLNSSLFEGQKDDVSHAEEQSLSWSDSH